MNNYRVDSDFQKLISAELCIINFKNKVMMKRLTMQG